MNNTSVRDKQMLSTTLTYFVKPTRYINKRSSTVYRGPDNRAQGKS